MQRAHLSASIAALALASAFVAPRLDGARPPPAAPVGDALLAPRPPPQTAPVPTAAPVTPRRSPWSAPTCDDDAAVVVAHELSSSVLEGRELAPERLVGALSRARSALPDHVGFGAVGSPSACGRPRGPPSIRGPAHGCRSAIRGRSACPAIPGRRSAAAPTSPSGSRRR